MTLSFHPGAAKRLSDLGEKLAADISHLKASPQARGEEVFTPDVVVNHTISAKTIQNICFNETNAAGEEVVRTFIAGNREVSVEGTLLCEFHALCDRILKDKSFGMAVSHGNVTKAVHSWLEARLASAQVATLPDFLVAELGKRLAEWEVWVPLPNLCIQSTIPVSKGHLRSVTREVFEGWKARIPRPPERKKDAKRFGQAFENRRDALQGYAAGVFSVIADDDRAGDIAVELTQGAIAALRVFHAACLEPNAVCATDVKYAATRPDYTVISFSAQSVVLRSLALAGATPPWTLSDSRIKWIRQNGLDGICAVFEDEKPTEFKREYIDALLLYSRAPLWPDLSDRLLYLLVPLESLFLKSQSEPIQQNVAERLALFIGSDLATRKKIIRAVRTVYEQRSAFVHHAHRVSDVASLRTFMLYAWMAMVSLPGVLTRWGSREEFLTSLDDKKLS
jgi:hypothetical protein